MQCPFLRKMNVKFCGLCRTRMIPLSGANLAAEQCSGADYHKCALVQERHEGPLPKDRCPFLSVGDVHYCEMAPFQILVPCNRATVSRCKDDGHKYCELFLSMAETGAEFSPAGYNCMDAAGRGGKNDEIPMPESLAYAPNHMWLDQSDGPTCHLGVDAFFGRALGEVDEVIYPQHGDNRRPMVRFKVGGVDFDLVFPNVMQGIQTNAHLVADPSQILRDPYGRGWLFQGVALPVQGHDVPRPLENGLLRGKAARDWMAEECDRLAAFAHEHLCQHDEDTGLLLQDGGQARGHLATALDRRTLIRLHTEFFNLRARRTES